MKFVILIPFGAENFYLRRLKGKNRVYSSIFINFDCTNILAEFADYAHQHKIHTQSIKCVTSDVKLAKTFPPYLSIILSNSN